MLHGHGIIYMEIVKQNEFHLRIACVVNAACKVLKPISQEDQT